MEEENNLNPDQQPAEQPQGEVPTEPQAEMQTEQPMAAPATPPAPGAPEKKSKMPLIIILVVIILAAGAYYWFFMKGDSEAKSADTMPQAEESMVVTEGDENTEGEAMAEEADATPEAMEATDEDTMEEEAKAPSGGPSIPKLPTPPADTTKTEEAPAEGSETVKATEPAETGGEGEGEGETVPAE